MNFEESRKIDRKCCKSIFHLHVKRLKENNNIYIVIVNEKFSSLFVLLRKETYTQLHLKKLTIYTYTNMYIPFLFFTSF